jgi:hypothetical protein
MECEADYTSESSFDFKNAWTLCPCHRSTGLNDAHGLTTFYLYLLFL